MMVGEHCFLTVQSTNYLRNSVGTTVTRAGSLLYVLTPTRYLN